MNKASAVRLVALRETPLSVDEVLEALEDPHAGGLNLFVGRVRDHDRDRAVSALSYSAHPNAEALLREVAEAVAAEFDITALAAVHRVGALAVGDAAVVVATCAAHRDAAFQASRALIDRLKERVPIWKEQTFADGDLEWVGV